MLPPPFTRKHVDELAPGDLVYRDSFGGKKVSATAPGRPIYGRPATIVMYDDGSSSIWLNDRLVAFWSGA